MSIRDEIREILAEGRTRTTAQLAEALGKPLIIVAQQLGGMHDTVQAGEGPGALWRLDPTALPAPRPPRAPRAPEAVEEAAAEEEAPPDEPSFDACVWLDGTVVIYGALQVDDRVQLTADQVQQLRALLDRVVPV
jgi:hypothetical protein